MSVDLGVDSPRPIAVRPLLPKIGAVLAELLGLAAPPALSVERLAEGQRLPVDDAVVGTSDAPLLLISVSGEPESIQLVGDTDHLAVSMIGLRSSLLYVLGAAAAIVLAREFGSGIWDDRRFFSHEEHTSPEALVARLRVAGRHNNYREAAAHVPWGPAGGP
jgi:hypothetical protein